MNMSERAAVYRLTLAVQRVLMSGCHYLSGMLHSSHDGTAPRRYGNGGFRRSITLRVCTVRDEF